MVEQIILTKEDIDLQSAFEFRGKKLPHSMFVGKSGSGKSVLLNNMRIRYIERGYTVVMRELAKFDFLSVFQKTTDIIIWLESDNYKGEDKQRRIDFWINYREVYGEEAIVIISSPEQIQEGKINVLAWDVMEGKTGGEDVAIQFFEFIIQLKLLREKHKQEFNLLFDIDEINKIFPSQGRNNGFSRMTQKKMAEAVFMFDEFRAFLVRFNFSTHQIHQTNIDVRGAAGLYFLKAMDRKDAKDLLNHEFYYVDKEKYQDLFKLMLGMPVDKCIFVNERKGDQLLDVFFTPEKYSWEECKEFVESFEPEWLVKPIKEDWANAVRIAEHLYETMGDDRMRKIFSLEEKDDYLKLVLRVHQFYDFTFSFEEYKDLYGNERFLDYISKKLMVLFENEKGVEFLIDVQSSERIIAKIASKVFKHEITELQAVTEILSQIGDVPTSKLAGFLKISEYAVRQLKSDYLRLKIRAEQITRENMYSTSLNTIEYLKLINEKKKELEIIDKKLDDLYSDPRELEGNFFEISQLLSKADELEQLCLY